MSDSIPSNVLATAAANLRASKFFQLAAFVMLIYDHMLTFSDEVERVWMQRFSGATYLFLINRYVTPIQFIIIIDAFHDPQWTKERTIRCSRFVLFEGAATIALVAVCEGMMILRVFALYNQNIWVLIFLGFVWTLQVVLSSVGISSGYPAPLPPGFVGCILSGSSTLFPVVWITPLVTDTCVFVLTIWRTKSHFRYFNITPTLQLFLRDGFLYFFTIFAVNLLNMLLFLMAPEDLKALGASFSQLLTSTVISRLILNLRAASYHLDDETTLESTDDQGQAAFMSRTSRRTGNFNRPESGIIDIPLHKMERQI